MTKIKFSSLITVKENCYNISILVADINLQYLNFEKYFEPPTCLMVDKGFNRSDNSGGGRLVKFKITNIYFLMEDLKLE